MAAPKTKQTKAKEAAAAKASQEKKKVAAPSNVPVVRDDVEAARSPTKRAAIKAWAATFNEKGVSVASANELKCVTDLKRPCGIMALDIDCGGGLSANRMSIISGPDNAGKSFLMIKYMVMHQRLMGAKSVIGIAQIEPFNFKRALNLGLVIEVPDNVIAEWNHERHLIGLPPYTTEEVRYFKRQIGEVMFFRSVTGDGLMDIVLEAVRSRHFGIIGIDSLSIILPAADQNKDVGETPMRAGNASLMTDFTRKYTPLTNALDEANSTSVIGLMQVRANADKATAGPMAKYMKDWQETGAWAIKHLKSIDVQIWGGGKIKSTIQGVEQVTGKELKWQIIKGKDGTHDGKTGDYPFFHEEFYKPGTDDLGSVFTEGFRRGVFQQSGSGISVVHPVTGKTISTEKNAKFITKLMAADFEYELYLRRLVLHAAGISCLYQPLP